MGRFFANVSSIVSWLCVVANLHMFYGSRHHTVFYLYLRSYFDTYTTDVLNIVLNYMITIDSVSTFTAVTIIVTARPNMSFENVDATTNCDATATTTTIHTTIESSSLNSGIFKGLDGWMRVEPVQFIWEIVSLIACSGATTTCPSLTTNGTQ